MSEYKDYGFTSEKPSHTAKYLLPVILKMLTKKNTYILDVGCGNGALARVLLNLGFDTYGIDASPMGISIAKRYYPDRFFLQDLTKERIPEEIKHIAFNTIISTEVIEHLYDPRKYVLFCKDLLLNNGGGEVILSTPYNGYFKNLALSIFNKWDIHLNPLWDGGHIKFWSKKTITLLLEEQGFKVIALKGAGRLPYLWKSMVIKAII